MNFGLHIIGLISWFVRLTCSEYDGLRGTQSMMAGLSDTLICASYICAGQGIHA